MSTDGHYPCRTQSLADYREHYQIDADSIVGPDQLDPVRHASEQRRLEALVRLLALQPGTRLLDAGCGSGWLADRFRQLGAEVWAMDLARQGIAGVRHRFPRLAVYALGDVYHLPFASGSFGVVVLSEVVEHLEDIRAALDEVRRVLQPGGQVAVSVPFRERIVHHLCNHCNRLTPASAHLHSFGAGELETHLVAAGLTVQKRCLVNNKFLELAGFPHWSRRWPHGFWQQVDRFFNRLIPRPAFLCVLASRIV